MLITDERRRIVDANRAASLLLRLPRDRVLELGVGDLTPEEDRPAIDNLWNEFMRAGTQVGPYDLAMPDVPRVRVEYSATANFEPGRHFTVLGLPTIYPASVEPTLEDLGRGEHSAPLSDREREVLAHVAMGETGDTIAAALHISTATVETHVRHCLSKLGARNRPHAIALALQRGEIALALRPGAASTADRLE